MTHQFVLLWMTHGIKIIDMIIIISFCWVLQSIVLRELKDIFHIDILVVPIQDAQPRSENCRQSPDFGIHQRSFAVHIREAENRPTTRSVPLYSAR